MTAASVHPLTARAPFDFSLSLRFLGGFTPGLGDGAQTGTELRRATRLDGQTVGVALRAAGDGVEAELHPQRALTDEQTERLLLRLSDFLSLNTDTAPFLRLAGQDAAFAPSVAALTGFHPPRFLTPFEAACWAIISQRTRLPLARSVKRGLSQDFGGGWEGLPAFPEPADLGGLTEAEATGRLGGERRGQALLAVVRAFSGVDREWLRHAPTADLGGWLRGIYGVGEWSAQLVLIRGLGRAEAMTPEAGPLEAELLRAARPVYGDLTAEELWAKARHYGDQAGLWATALRSLNALRGLNELRSLGTPNEGVA